MLWIKATLVVFAIALMVLLLPVLYVIACTIFIGCFIVFGIKEYHRYLVDQKEKDSKAN